MKWIVVEESVRYVKLRADTVTGIRLTDLDKLFPDHGPVLLVCNIQNQGGNTIIVCHKLASAGAPPFGVGTVIER